MVLLVLLKKSKPTLYYMIKIYRRINVVKLSKANYEWFKRTYNRKNNATLRKCDLKIKKSIK